ncbi:hypothetical protein [Sulfurimonas sp.]|uniref:hypothetical protein n=1 Tax=Sulfurimonas sp. TaxID=2022749 RepID=UPI0019F559B9|nr:hypothetical protein [Sulfurimonas sp.]MBE0513920.1 hypothetical protein [Sulfurimonas sp.]
MSINKAITYSLLAHIRNNATLIRGPLDIFVPLIKRTLSKMNTNKIYGGKNLTEIVDYAKILYDIEFPVPVLRSILEVIALELQNTNAGAFILNDDNSFAIANYTFVEFEESVRKRKEEIKKLEQLFQDFCGKSNLIVEDSKSIFSFLEKNKLSLAKYLSHSEELNGHDYSIEVQFVNYFRNIPPVYDLLKSLYLGSILSEYLEYKPTDICMNIELLFDTNFIISLLDLNTPESTHTCNTLLKIAKQQGYILTILEETIEEIKSLLKKKADGLHKSFFVKQVYMEDIYNACERRNLTQADLERMIDNIEVQVLSFNINKVSIDKEIKKIALASPDYSSYKQKRTSDISAQHDTFALHYVKEKRGNKKISDFADVNCWFVNNAISRGFKQQYEKTYQPEIIKADDLLSILWLSNPQVNEVVSASEMADIGLSSLVSLTFTASLPQTSIIKEFEGNIEKYAKDEVSTQDIIRIATRIADKQLTNIDELNRLASEDKEEFVKRLEDEAKKQEQLEIERVEALSTIIEKFTHELGKIEETKQKRADEKKLIKKLEKEYGQTQDKVLGLNSELEATKKALKKVEIDDNVENWKQNSRLILLLFIAVYLPVAFYISMYDIEILKEPWIPLALTVVSALWFFPIKLFYDRHWNHSNIESYKKSME